MQNELNFEAAIKNSLVNLTNSWNSKYQILALHTGSDNCLPLVIRENGLFSLSPSSFVETLNFKLDEFILSYECNNQ